MKHCALLLSALLLGFLAACQSTERVTAPISDEAQTQADLALVENNALDQNPTPSNDPSPWFDEDAQRKVMIYFRHSEYDGLIPLQRAIVKNSRTSQLLQVIDHLTIPPREAEGRAIWPKDTYVREVYMVADGTVVIDFKQKFLANLQVGAGGETYLVYSLVNSILDNFEDATQVKILVEGNGSETLLGHVDIETPLKRSAMVYTVIPEPRLEDLITIEELEPLPTQAESNTPKDAPQN
ncbi:GerMN domain-containing protein [Acanthopleuribacter pedis]|uniref:GerMN domain-containing protein n=1 Tax=Acanthopleuribacter pedis TaxID=442870 RepID=A0A8J7QFN9_9BACT|nr:GerMN domain-containing protein [Acanthopleuribacter pedis]MBO1317605.1 GerMN domain-containing protein [Acanthopleuribacter pedis]